MTKSNVNIVGFSCSSSCCEIRIWEQRTLVVRSVLRGLRKAVILSVEVVDKKKMMYFTEQQLTTRQQLPYNKTFEWYDGFPVLDNKTNTFGSVEREPLDPWVRGEGESFSCPEHVRWGLTGRSFLSVLSCTTVKYFVTHWGNFLVRQCTAVFPSVMLLYSSQVAKVIKMW